MVFSVDFVVAEDNDDFAVDWDYSKRGEWSLSCKERFTSVYKWHIVGDMRTSIYGELAYHAILSKFRLSPEKYSLDDVSKMSPKQLSELGTRNPVSDAAGDGRRASEVG